MSQDLKHIIRQEYLKCAQDPAHFMKKYCNIQHPQRGRVIFNLYPFQEKVLRLWRDNPYSIVLKSRQLGISTLGAGYSLWLMLFHKDKNVLCIATKQETARNMVTKVKFMFDNLPSWLKIPAEENNKLSLRLSNGSQIKATSASSDAGRSEAVSLLLVDEAAFIDQIGEIWASAQQTLATGGGAIVLSTPYGTGNWFHQTWVRAEASENDFLPIKLPWFVHPERDEAWRKRQDELLGDPRLASQECDCDFSTSGDVVFYNEYLEFYENTYIKEPLERRGVDRNLWVWDALLVIENANIGWASIQVAIDRNYPNLYYSPKSGEVTADSYFDSYADTSRMVAGFTMSLRTRPMIIGKFQEYISDKAVTIQSKRLIEEMKVFVWKNGRAEAQQGYNDDLVMAFGVAMFLRDTSFKFRQQGIDLTKAALNNIGKSSMNTAGAYSRAGIRNPYQMENNKGGMEDLKWLF